MPEVRKTIHLQDLWDFDVARQLSDNPLGLLRYRSNLLGADLRITNFGGGNTSSKFELPDPFTGKPFEYSVNGDVATLHGENPLPGSDRLNRYYEIRIKK